MGSGASKKAAPPVRVAAADTDVAPAATNPARAPSPNPAAAAHGGSRDGNAPAAGAAEPTVDRDGPDPVVPDRGAPEAAADGADPSSPGASRNRATALLGVPAPQESDLGRLTMLAADEAAELFSTYTEFIFHKIEAEGQVTFDGFTAMAQSQTLGLHTTDAEAEELMQRFSRDGGESIAKARFQDVMKELLQRRLGVRYGEREADPAWQWHAMYFDDDASSLPVYYNALHDKMTYERPDCVQSRALEECHFFEQLVRVSDGQTITSYVEDDGQRLYLDWETNEWHPFPEEWYADVTKAEELEPAGRGEADEASLGDAEGAVLVVLPSGDSFETAMENGIRIFYDPQAQEWAPMPVALEVHVPFVIKALQRLEATLPHWSNTNEKVLALRENCYRIDDTVAWKERELELASQDPLLSQLDSGDVLFNATALESAGKGDPASHQLQEEKEALQRELNEQRVKAEISQARIAALELQVEAASAAEANHAATAALQARIADLESELAVVKAGGDMLAEAETKAAGLRAELSAAQAKLLALQSNQRNGLAKMQFEVTSLKHSAAALRQQVREGYTTPMLEALQRVSQTLTEKSEQAIGTATRELVAKYRFEVRQRKLLYNELQELKGNIRVFCRVRWDDRVKCVLGFPDQVGMGTPTELECPNPRGEGSNKKFTFDRVYSPSSTQKEVFTDTDAVITSVVDGYNTCIIAYGQTGSGKTHTMMGTVEDQGVNRRAIRELLKVCAQRTEVAFSLTVSLVEIYNERITDLLSHSGAGGGDAVGEAQQQKCELRMNPKTKAGYISNLTVRTMTCVEDVVETLAEGDRNRHTAATKMNSHSSRSHLLLIVTVHGEDKVSGQKTTGKLTLVDLAGSERVGKTEATGQRLVEAAAINKSLTALGQVFTALRLAQSHVPYRNSKLTHLLADSLGGDAKCCVFIAVSPAESNLHETVGTLQFGSSIRNIELGPQGKQGKLKAAKEKKGKAGGRS